MRNWAWPQPCRKQGLNMTPVRWGMAAVPVGGGAWPDNETTRRAKLAARTAHGRVATHRHTQRPGTTGMEGAGGTGGHGRASRSTTPSRRLACGDLAGGRARRRPEHPWGHKQHKQEGRRPPAHTATRHHWCGGRRRDLPRCRWAAAGPGRASRRRAERSSRRGRLAGGTPPTGTPSSPAQQDAQSARPNNTPRGARNASGATRNTAQGRGPAGPRP